MNSTAVGRSRIANISQDKREQLPSESEKCWSFRAFWPVFAVDSGQNRNIFLEGVYERNFLLLIVDCYSVGNEEIGRRESDQNRMGFQLVKVLSVSMNDKVSYRELARDALSNFESGPDAPIRATAQALERVKESRAIVFVEGISDQIALETLALRRGRELDAEGILILPIGGAQAITRYLIQFGPQGMDMVLAGLYDAAEENIFRRGLEKAGLGSPQTRVDMEHVGFFACVDDLEFELIRAVGPGKVEALFDTQGDLGSFRTLQKQSAWRNRKLEPQMHRFLRSSSRRHLRYVHLLVDSIDLDRVPHPLDAVLTHI